MSTCGFRLAPVSVVDGNGRFCGVQERRCGGLLAVDLKPSRCSRRRGGGVEGHRGRVTGFNDAKHLAAPTEGGHLVLAIHRQGRLGSAEADRPHRGTTDARPEVIGKDSGCRAMTNRWALAAGPLRCWPPEKGRWSSSPEV